MQPSDFPGGGLSELHLKNRDIRVMLTHHGVTLLFPAVNKFLLAT